MQCRTIWPLLEGDAAAEKGRRSTARGCVTGRLVSRLPTPAWGQAEDFAGCNVLKLERRAAV